MRLAVKKFSLCSPLLVFLNSDIAVNRRYRVDRTARADAQAGEFLDAILAVAVLSGLLNGGRNRGVMKASARGAKKAGGTVIGILPDKTTAKASPDLDIAVLTGMGDARNAINVLSSDVVIACPGSLGTMSEIVLALKNDKCVILLGYNDVPLDLAKFHKRGQLMLADDPEEAVARAAAVLAALDQR